MFARTSVSGVVGVAKSVRISCKIADDVSFAIPPSLDIFNWSSSVRLRCDLVCLVAILLLATELRDERHSCELWGTVSVNK